MGGVVAVGSGVGVFVGVAVGLTVAVGAGVTVGATVAMGVGRAVGLEAAVGMEVRTGVGVSVGRDVAVGVAGIGMAVPVGGSETPVGLSLSTPSDPHPETTTIKTAAAMARPARERITRRDLGRTKGGINGLSVQDHELDLRARPWGEKGGPILVPP